MTTEKKKLIYLSLFKFDLDNLFGQAGLFYEILRPTNTCHVSSRVRQCIDGVANTTVNLTKGDNIDHILEILSILLSSKSFLTKI